MAVANRKKKILVVVADFETLKTLISKLTNTRLKSNFEFWEQWVGSLSMRAHY